MRPALVLCALLCATLEAADKWTYAAADHFEVYGTGGDRQVRDALVYFERVHAFFTDFLKRAPRTRRTDADHHLFGREAVRSVSSERVGSAFYQSGPDATTLS